MNSQNHPHRWRDPKLNDNPQFNLFREHILEPEDLIRCLQVTRRYKHREPWTVWTAVINDESYSDIQRSLTLFEFFKRFATPGRPIADFLNNQDVAGWFQYASFRDINCSTKPPGIDPHEYMCLMLFEISTPFMRRAHCSLVFSIDRLCPGGAEPESINREFDLVFKTRERPCEYAFDQIGYYSKYFSHFL